jgi:hypothetical protein
LFGDASNFAITLSKSRFDGGNHFFWGFRHEISVVEFHLGSFPLPLSGKEILL